MKSVYIRSKTHIIIIIFLFSHQLLYSQFNILLETIGNSNNNAIGSYGEITGSYCGLPNTSSITIHPNPFLNEITYTWSGPSDFSDTTQMISNLKSGFYHVTIKGNYFNPFRIIVGRNSNISSSTEHLVFFVGNYATWITTNLKLLPINKLTSEKADSPNFNTAYSLNHTGEIRDTEWVNFRHVYNDKKNEEIFYIGINKKGESTSMAHVEHGILINNTILSSTYNIIENGSVHMNESSNNKNYDLYFRISKRNNETIVKLMRKLEEEIDLLYEFLPSSTSDYQLVVGISTKETSIEQTLVTFCPPVEPPYNVLKKMLDGGFAQVMDSTLKFMFDEEYFIENNIPISYKIYKYKGGDINTTVSFTRNTLIKYGDNRYELDLTDLMSNGKENYYLLEVINDKNEKWYLKFRINQ